MRVTRAGSGRLAQLQIKVRIRDGGTRHRANVLRRRVERNLRLLLLRRTTLLRQHRLLSLLVSREGKRMLLLREGSGLRAGELAGLRLLRLLERRRHECGRTGAEPSLNTIRA